GYFGGETIHIGTSLTDEARISYNTALNEAYIGINNSNLVVLTEDGYFNIGSETPTSKFSVSGSIASNITTKTSNFNLGINDSKILVDATSSVVTGTLPLASSCSGREYHLKKIDSTTNNMVINTSGGDTIDDNSAIVTNVQYRAYTVTSNGTN